MWSKSIHPKVGSKDGFTHLQSAQSHTQQSSRDQVQSLCIWIELLQLSQGIYLKTTVIKIVRNLLPQRANSKLIILHIQTVPHLLKMLTLSLERAPSFTLLYNNTSTYIELHRHQAHVRYRTSKYVNQTSIYDMVHFKFGV